MKDEIEVTFLEVDVEKLRESLAALGATQKSAVHSKRKLLDFPGLPLEARNAWVRLRDEGDKVTLTYKEWKEDGSMKEIETIVSDFDSAAALFAAAGFIVKRYEENKREKWVLGDFVFDIDTWPLLPTYVEIEGPSFGAIQEISEKLGFAWDKRVPSSPLKIYASYGINLKDYAELTFDRQVKL